MGDAASPRTEASYGSTSKNSRTPMADIGKPLQVCEIDFEENVVNCCQENLQQIEDNLKKLATAVGNPDLKVGVIAVMGMYRTGKSFLLDLLMRYLRQDGPITRFDPSLVWGMAEETYSTDNFTWLASNSDERISEGQNSVNERGFHWRPGIEKCTKGIWLWSKPFLLEHSDRDDALAVLVMDTQGAWDSQMSNEHSACIFGITSLLSSKLIYNLQNRISEEKIDNLDYFTTFASVVIGEARDAVDVDEDEEPGLGDLHFLVRDWEYFDDGWSLEQCTRQVSQHLMTHLDPNNVSVEERRETIQRLHNLFRSIMARRPGVNLCCLPHPGPKIPKGNWRGNVTDINTDFLYLLTHFFANLTHGEYPLKVAAPLGQELTVNSFCRVIQELTTAFRNAKPDAVSLRRAFVNCETFRAKEEVVRGFQSDLDSIDGIQEPEELHTFLQDAKAHHMLVFQKRMSPLFGNDEASRQMKDETLADVAATLDEKMTWIEARNKSLFSQATFKLVAGPVVGLPIVATLASLPHILVYMMFAAGGAAHVNARAGDQGVQGWLAPETLQKVWADLSNFAQARYLDLKQVMFVGKDCDKLPKRIGDAMTGSSGGNDLIPKAAAVAAAGGVTAAAAQQFAKKS